MMGSSSDSEEQGGQKIQLYSYWKSSCSWRVRIALHLKRLPFDYKAVNLLKNENQSPEFLQLNPLGYVPVILDGDDVVADSLAIILYLDEKYPEPYLMPTDLQMGAINLQIANLVGSGIQPFQNISVLRHIEEKLGSDEKIAWAQKYIEKGFAALEKLLKNIAGKYATGDEIYLADIFLAPQIHAARTRFNVDMEQFPILNRLDEAYKSIPAFESALPEHQPDAVKL